MAKKRNSKANDEFKENLQKHFNEFKEIVSTEKGDWTVKGFIDVYKNIYTISVDTKVVSKIIELMLFPVMVKFAKENGYDFELCNHQNHYPDITFISKKSGEKIAIDLKSTYKTHSNKVSGMTLGAFTGYFRNRDSNKNIKYPYKEYSRHYILGVIYNKTDQHKAETLLEEKGYTLNDKIRKLIGRYLIEQSDELIESIAASLDIEKTKHVEFSDTFKQILESSMIDERRKYAIDDLPNILSVVRDFQFFVQEKWKIAIDRPGSGNTKNIGSTTKIDELINGTAIFTKHKNGEKLFNDYWKNYLTIDMAKAIDMEAPNYTNLAGYLKYKSEN